jgi:hypothetical protein
VLLQQHLTLEAGDATAFWQGTAAAAALQVSNERYKRHTFDGDGMVLSFSFDQGRVWFKNKFVHQGLRGRAGARRLQACGCQLHNLDVRALHALGFMLGFTPTWQLFRP